MLKFRHLLVAGFLLASMKSNAHRIEYYTSDGCLSIGTSLQIDAYVVYAPSNTYYQWQWKGSTGGWNYFSTTGTTTINGSSYAVSNYQSGPAANQVPNLTFATPNANLDGVQLRCLMRENYLPSNSSPYSSTIWGGDNSSETRMARIRYNSASGACSISCDDNLLTNASGYYGGFEQVVYSSSNQSYADNNWGTGEGDTDYPVSSGSYRVTNNPNNFSSGFGAFAPHSGKNQMVIKGSTNTSNRVWYKDVTVTTGQQYSFSVWVAKVDGTAPTIKLYANSTELASSSITGAVGAWVQVTSVYNATAAGTVTFSIKNGSAASGIDNWAMDDICLTVLPSITIGDYVWADINRDGKQDANESGISGVTVKLWVDANMDNVADNATAYATATTNGSGAYTFTNIPRGKYFVQFPTTVTNYTGLTTQDAAGVAVGSNSTANVTTGRTGTHDFTGDYLFKDAGYVKNITISGTAFNDPTALVDNTVNGTAISAVSGSALYANLFRGTTFVASTAVSGGTYTFSNLPGNAVYTVAISTVAATAATTTVTSTLPSGWMNTGENIGTGTGNDGTANGVINVTLADINIANVNFGMQQPPTANTATLPSQTNPGGATFITVPATNFGGVDAGGTISAIKITGFPTNATTIKVNGIDYTSTTIGSAPNVPTNALGQPTQAIAVDPIDGNVSVVIPYKTIDNGGAQSSNTGSVTVPVVVPPDLTPVIIANPSVMNGITNFNITIKVAEVGEGTPTSGLITVLVPKDPRISFTYNNTLTTIGSTSVNNANWSLDNSNQFFYIFTSTTVIPASGFSTIGLAATFNPQNAQGVYVLSSVIKSGSGSEVRTSNNSSSISLTYSPN